METLSDHRLVKTTILNTKPYQVHSKSNSNKKIILEMDNQEHQLDYKLKTQQLLNRIHFSSTKSMLRSLKKIAEKKFPNKSKNNLKPWNNHPELTELSRKQKDTWLKMRTKCKTIQNMKS